MNKGDDTSPPVTTVLLVEDEPLIRMMVGEHLRRSSYRVLEAANANEALAILGVTPVAVMVTDSQMPGKIDGLELVALARAQWPSMKIIVASAHAPNRLAVEVIDAFVGKPYLPERILDRIESLLHIETAATPPE